MFIPVTRRVKGYNRFVGKYVTGRNKRFRFHSRVDLAMYVWYPPRKHHILRVVTAKGDTSLLFRTSINLIQGDLFLPLSRPHPGTSPGGLCQTWALESCDEERWPRGEISVIPVCLFQLGRSWREERAVDRFVVSRDVVLESPAAIGEVPEQKLTESPSAREQTTRSRPVEAFKRHCPGEARRLSKPSPWTSNLKSLRSRSTQPHSKHDQVQSSG